jgi:hypothetical protein
MLLRPLVLVAVLPALSVAGAAQARPLTTAPTLSIDIHVTINDKQIVLDRHSAPRGVEARFIIRNVGTEKHAFTLSGQTTATGKQRGFSETVGAGGRKTVRVFLDFRGRLSYHDGLRADRAKAGMRGVFVIS